MWGLLGTKTLLLLKLDGERSYGIHERESCEGGGRTFIVTNIDRLSPADRAGIACGDELLNVRVIGIDRKLYPWGDMALTRLEHLHEICLVSVTVKKPADVHISSSQQQRHNRYISSMAKAKVVNITSKRTRGDYLPSQLRRVVARLYDEELECFARNLRALPRDERPNIALPVARVFVDETRLPAAFALNGDEDALMQVPGSGQEISTQAPGGNNQLAFVHGTGESTDADASGTDDTQSDSQSSTDESRFVLIDPPSVIPAVKVEPRE